MPEIDTDVTRAVGEITAVARDATYVAIGAGLIAFQRAQVRRQELLKRLAESRPVAEERVQAARADLTGALQAIDARVEDVIGRVEAAVLPLEERLPDQARVLLGQVRTQAREVRGHLRGIVLPTAP